MSVPRGSSLAGALAEPLAFGVVTLAFPTVGAICLLRRPSQRVGWLLCVVGLGWALANAGTGYAKYARDTSQMTVPGVEWALWLGGNSWPIYLSQGVLLLLLLLFPTGSPISARWRPVAWVVVGWAAVSAFAAAFASGPLEDNLNIGIANPAGVPGEAGAVLRAMTGWLLYGFVVLFAVTALALLVRFRRSSGAERQQIKWIAVGVALVAVLIAGTYGAGALLGAGPTSADPLEVDGPARLLLVAGVLSVGLVPVTIGIAILRYRLYDIDRLVHRTLVYSIVTLLIGAIYGMGVLLLQVPLSQVSGGEALAVAGSTLAAAALFQPVRTAVQRLVDRRFDRARYDGARTIGTFGTRLRDDVDLESVLAELKQVVRATIGPSGADVWLRPPRNLAGR